MDNVLTKTQLTWSLPTEIIDKDTTEKNIINCGDCVVYTILIVQNK